MKKIIAVILSLVMILPMAACQDSRSETSAELAVTEETTLEETSQTIAEEVSDTETLVITTMTEPESLEEDLKADFDYEAWFAELRTSYEKGGTSITDSSKVGTALYELSDGEYVDDMIFDASVAGCSPLRAQGDVEASVTGSSIFKMEGDALTGGDASFYGENAAVQALDGAILTIKDSDISAAAENATGVFSYNGAVIFIADSTVNVSGGGAGGIQVAGGGNLYACNLKVTSESKAAIRSDRGGGILQVVGGEYTSNGSNGCPAVYSTADITVTDAYLTSNHSRAVIIEGKNSVTLVNCITSGQDESTKEGSVKANVLLYQSASGDASEGTSVFTMTGGTMTANTGAMFYCTNTSSIVNLNQAEFVYSDEGTFMIVSAGRWGRDGSNGGECTLNAEDQKMEGNIIVDSISSLIINMASSDYTGAINPEGDAGYVSVSLDGSSTWTLTGDSYITEFEGSLDNVDTGSFHLYVNGSQVK